MSIIMALTQRHARGEIVAGVRHHPACRKVERDDPDLLSVQRGAEFAPVAIGQARQAIDLFDEQDVAGPAVVALQQAVAQVTKEKGEPLKRRLRTGTVVTNDDRNWELQWSKERQIMNISRAIAVDMESATIATQGFRMRVPYGTLLCVSDKPLHGEIKLPGAANAFYERAIREHMQISVAALGLLQSFDGRRTRASSGPSTSRRFDDDAGRAARGALLPLAHRPVNGIDGTGSRRREQSAERGSSLPPIRRPDGAGATNACALSARSARSRPTPDFAAAPAPRRSWETAASA